VVIVFPVLQLVVGIWHQTEKF